MGCADHKFRNFGSKQQYVDELENVVEWRDNFFRAIFMSKYRVDLRSTCIFGQRQGDIKQLLEICVNELNDLSSEITDYNLANTKHRLHGHHVNMELLFKNKLIIENKKRLYSKKW